MKNNEDTSMHQEIMDDITTCRRELMGLEVSHRNIPNLINRGKAVAALVTAAHREEIMEAKRNATLLGLSDMQVPKRLKLKAAKIK